MNTKCTKCQKEEYVGILTAKFLILAGKDSGLRPPAGEVSELADIVELLQFAISPFRVATISLGNGPCDVHPADRSESKEVPDALLLTPLLFFFNASSSFPSAAGESEIRSCSSEALLPPVK